MKHFTLCINCSHSGKVIMPNGSIESIVCLNPKSSLYNQAYFIDSPSHRELIQNRKLYEWEHPLSNFDKLGCNL
jgi:hypothetical protein